MNSKKVKLKKLCCIRNENATKWIYEHENEIKNGK